MKHIFCFAMFVFAFASRGEDPPELSAEELDAPPKIILGAGREITIMRYLFDSDVFEISLKEQPEVGPNYLTPEALQKGLGIEGSRQEFIRKMKKHDQARILTEQVQFMSHEEMVERTKKQKAMLQDRPKQTKKKSKK